MNAEPWAILLIVLATIVAAVGSVLLKIGAGKLKKSLTAIIKNWQVLLGFCFYGTGSIMFVPALRGGDLSVLFPITSLTYIWTVLLSKKVLNETINSWKWIGIALIMVGVILIAR